MLHLELHTESLQPLQLLKLKLEVHNVQKDSPCVLSCSSLNSATPSSDVVDSSEDKSKLAPSIPHSLSVFLLLPKALLMGLFLKWRRLWLCWNLKLSNLLTIDMFSLKWMILMSSYFCIKFVEYLNCICFSDFLDLNPCEFLMKSKRHILKSSNIIGKSQLDVH